MKEKYEYFVRRPMALIMITLLDSPAYKSQLMRKTKLSYSHINRIVDMLNDMGLVEIENHSKTNIIRLTDEGEKVAKDIRKIVSILRWENEFWDNSNNFAHNFCFNICSVFCPKVWIQQQTLPRAWI